jgi:hypothetical protein
MAESRTLVLAAVVAIISLLVGMAAGYGISSFNTAGKTAVTTTTTTVTLSTSVIHTTSSYTCEVSGPPIGALVHLMNSTGYPVPGVNISGVAIGYCNNERQVHQMSSITNASGWADFRQEVFGTYYLSFTYEGQLFFNFTVPTMPTTLSIATFYLFGGNLTIQYCVYGDMTRCSSF